MNRKELKEEFISLNSELNEFNLEELEQRLETDPLAMGGLLELSSKDQLSLYQFSSEECAPHCSGGSCLYH